MAALPIGTSLGEVRLNIEGFRGKASDPSVFEESSRIYKIDMKKINTLLEDLCNTDKGPISELHDKELTILNEKIFGSSRCCDAAKDVNLIAALILGFTAGLPCFFNDEPVLGFFITGIVATVSYLYFENKNRKGQREMMRALIQKNNLCSQISQHSMNVAKEILNAYQCDIIALEMLHRDPDYSSDLGLLEPVIFDTDATSEVSRGARSKKFKDSIDALESNFAKLESSVIKYELDSEQVQRIVEPLKAVVALIKDKSYLCDSLPILREHQAKILKERLKFLTHTLKARKASERRRLSFATKPLIAGRPIGSLPAAAPAAPPASPATPPNSIATYSSDSSSSDSPSGTPPLTPPLASESIASVSLLSERPLTPPTESPKKPLPPLSRRIGRGSPHIRNPRREFANTANQPLALFPAPVLNIPAPTEP